MRTELLAPPGWVSGLLVGLPGKRLVLAPYGNVWLDPAAPWILLDVGTVPTSGSRLVDVPMPGYVRPGTAISFQALTLQPGSWLQFSTGVTVLLH